ncbi:MAG: hypothetical protein H3Z50_01945 [archaeon]|nr:hypothetical protein [archaeon]
MHPPSKQMRQDMFIKLGKTSDIGDFLEKTVAGNLQSRGFEVKISQRGCDIVAEKDGSQVIIECKMNIRRRNWFQILGQREYKQELKPHLTILLSGNMRIFAPLWNACEKEGISIHPCWSIYHDAFPYIRYDPKTERIFEIM